MKKLLLITTIALMSLGLTGCESKVKTSAEVYFSIASDCKTAENLAKIKTLIISKDLPMDQVTISVEGEQNDIEIRVKQILADMLFKVSAEELKALNTGATYVEYSAKFVGFSAPIATSIKQF